MGSIRDDALEDALAAGADEAAAAADADMEGRLRARLFGGAPVDDTPQRIGRYIVRGRIGAGGMGEVFDAFDTELERSVALKLIVARAAAGRSRERIEQRLRQEARALAQLDHPNIVRVFDVGVHEGRVFMAMERLFGQTIRAWQAERSPTVAETLDRYRLAGLALVAAHQSGLVHRDFKPDNVMVTDEGEVRVLDFGLAQAFRDSSGAEMPQTDGDGPNQAGRTRTLVGTPGYMAPEQFSQREVTAATDQFAFCASLYEAVFGRHPLPRGSLGAARQATLAGRIEPPPRGVVGARVRRAIMRGLSVEPADRWPSMQRLLDELHPSASRRATRLAISGVALAGVAVIGLMANDEPECESASDHVARSFGPQRREALERTFSEAGDFGRDVWVRTSPSVEAYAAELGQAMHGVCLTPERGPKTDLRRGCLRDRQRDLQATLEVFEHADASVVAQAHTMLAGLRPIEACEDIGSEPDRPRNPQADAVEADLARVRALVSAGRFAEAELPIADAVTRARDIDDPHLLASSLLLRGQQQRGHGDSAQSHASLSDAYFTARSIAPDIAQRAAIELVAVTFDAGQDLESGRQWARHARATRLARPDRLRDALLSVQETRLLVAFGALDDATAAAHAAIEALESTPGAPLVRIAEAHTLLGTALSNAGEYEQAEARYRHALQIYETELGPHHPETAGATANVGTVLQRAGRALEAEPLFRRALAIRRAILRPDHPAVLGAMINLGTSLYAQSRHDEAIAVLVEAIDLGEGTEFAEHVNYAWAVNNLGTLHLQRGQPEDLEAGRRHLARAQLVFERVYGPHHPAVADVSSNLGMLAMTEGRTDAARDKFEHALAIYEAGFDPTHPQVVKIRTNLARVALTEGNADTALTAVNLALAPFAEPAGTPPLEAAAAWVVQASALHALHRDTDAIAALDLADAAYGDRLPPDHPSRDEIAKLRRRIGSGPSGVP